METIDEIVREMRALAQFSENGYCAQFSIEYADRIDAAAKRIIGECESWRKQALEENSALDIARADNARLRAALNPVLECSCEVLHLGDTECCIGSLDAIDAIDEAKRVYKESEVKK